MASEDCRWNEHTFYMSVYPNTLLNTISELNVSLIHFMHTFEAVTGELEVPIAGVVHFISSSLLSRPALL